MKKNAIIAKAITVGIAALLLFGLALSGCDQPTEEISTTSTTDTDEAEDTEGTGDTWPPSNPIVARVWLPPASQVRNTGQFYGQPLWFRLNISTAGTYIISGVDYDNPLFNAAEKAPYADVVVSLYDSGGSVLQANVDIGDGNGGSSHYIQRSFSTGTYYIKMFADSNGRSGTYIMDIFK